MNILMVHPHDLFCPQEPWTVRIKSIAQEFVKEGHAVRLCYFPLGPRRAAAAASVDSVPIYPLDREFSPKAYWRNTMTLIELSKWADIVHFQKCHHYASLPAAAAAFVNGKPLHYDWDDWEEKIFFESCSMTHKTFLIGCFYRMLERLLPSLADTVSVASRHLRDLSVKAGKDRQDIFFAPVGADQEMFTPARDGAGIRDRYGIDGPLVLYVGQLHGAQYVDLLIDAANVVLHKKPQTKFMIVGTGFLERALRERTRQMGIDDKIIFTGSVDHDQIPSYVAASDICVAVFKDTDVTKCKSPLKIAEYLAGGKPIVASDVGEVRAMLAGVGMLVKPGDPHALAAGVIDFLSDEQMRKSAGELARKRAEVRYSWRSTSKNLLDAYEKARRK